MRKRTIVKIGKKYHRLTVLDVMETICLCQCECGEVCIAPNYAVGGLKKQSCGCARVDFIKSVNQTHQMSKTRPYRIWSGIKKRCTNPNYQHYHRYGGRGISYDKKWDTFEGFWEDMKDGYDKNLSIDRIDNEGNYCKENCRWTTQKEQANNSNWCTFVEIRGERKSVAEWCRKLGLNINTVYDRISHKNMTAFEAITIPIKSRKKCSLRR